MDASTLALVQDIFRRERGSFLHYTADAYPWTTSAGETALIKLRKLIATETATVTALGRYLMRRHVPVPSSVSYPSRYTAWNYVALDAIVRLLIDAQQKDLAALERDLPHVDDAGIQAELKKLADVKRRTLIELQALIPEPAAA
jgi:hypothetical protein